MSADTSKIRPARTAPVRRTRNEHAQETAQDYVELIAELIAEAGEARAIDLARRLGVTHPACVFADCRLEARSTRQVRCLCY